MDQLKVRDRVVATVGSQWFNPGMGGTVRSRVFGLGGLRGYVVQFDGVNPPLLCPPGTVRKIGG